LADKQVDELLQALTEGARHSHQSSKAMSGLLTEASSEDLKRMTSFGSDTIGREPSRPKDGLTS